MMDTDQSSQSMILALGAFIGSLTPLVIHIHKSLIRARLRKRREKPVSNQAGQASRSWWMAFEIMRITAAVGLMFYGLFTLMRLERVNAPLTTADAATIALALACVLPAWFSKPSEPPR